MGAGVTGRRGFLITVAGLPAWPVLHGCAAQDEELAPDPALESASILQLEKRLEGRLGVYAINTANGVSVAYREQERFALQPTEMLAGFRQLQPGREGAASMPEPVPASMGPRALAQALLAVWPTVAALPTPDDGAPGHRLHGHAKARQMFGSSVPPDWSVLAQSHHAQGATGVLALIIPPGKPAAALAVLAESQAAKGRSAIVAAAARQSFGMLGMA